MGRALFAGILSAITAVTVVGGAAPAQAREPVPITDFTLPGIRDGHQIICPFDVHVGVVANEEFQEVTTLADGTTITRITGKLVLSFTNDATGKTIVRNVSGATTKTAHPETSDHPVTGTEVGADNNWWGFGPKSRANTGEPGLVFTSGPVELQFTGNVVTRSSVFGSQVNGCALLEGPSALNSA